MREYNKLLFSGDTVFLKRDSVGDSTFGKCW